MTYAGFLVCVVGAARRSIHLTSRYATGRWHRPTGESEEKSMRFNPDYTPADVKEALQNTADKLTNDYSVYEVGAGLVDVKEAVHSDVAIEVLNQTLNFDAASGINKMIDDKTGSIVYGTIYKKSGATNTGTKNIKFKTIVLFY